MIYNLGQSILKQGGFVKLQTMLILFFTIFSLFFYQNCGKHLQSEDNSSTSSTYSSAPTENYSNFLNSEALTNLTLNGSVDELSLGSQVQWFGIFPTTTFSHESIDPDRFKMMLKELQGRTNIISLLYISEQALSIIKAKGSASQRNLSALQIVEEKISAAESLGFKIAIELTPLFFNIDQATLKYDLSSLKSTYLQDWAAAVQIFKRHPNVIWFYPFDEPYWNAKNAGISYSKMAQHLKQMNTLIKKDLPNGKIVFVEAFAIIDEAFTVPIESDYVGIDCYGNFDNCFGESIPSYYNKISQKMTPQQKFIIIPDAFDFKAGDENGSWQNNVINQSKKYLDFTRKNNRIEGVVLFLYNSPLDLGLNIERLASTRQGSLLNLFYDQVSLKNQALIRNSPATSPHINISYKDINGKMINVETTDQTPIVAASPLDYFDMGFSRPLIDSNLLECSLFSPDGQLIDCKSMMYRQARYSTINLKKGVWSFKFKVNHQIFERKIEFQAAVKSTPTQNTLTTVNISCSANLYAGDSGSCTATDFPARSLASGYWTVNGIKQTDSSTYTYSWQNIPAGTYQIQGFAKDTSGRDVVSNIITVTVKNPTLTISCPNNIIAGSNPTCQATSVGQLNSGYWTVNDQKISGSENQLNYTFNNVPAGTYKVQGLAKDKFGNTIYSNVLTVLVRP